MRRFPSGPALAALLMAGCHQAASRPPQHASARALDTVSARVTGRQAADVQYAMGRSLEEAGKPAEAEDAYKKALSGDPRRGDAHARLAVLCDGRGDFEAGSDHFARALRRSPRDPDLLCDYGYHEYLRRDLAAAEDFLFRALEADPGHARAHNNLGIVLARKGDREGALAAFARAGSDPADSRANLALVLAMDGRVPEAEALYAEALAARSDSEGGRRGMRALAAARSRSEAGGLAARPPGATPAFDAEIRRTSAADIRLPFAP